MSSCETCGAGEAALRVRYWQAAPAGGNVGMRGEPVSRLACHACGGWLAGVLGLAPERGATRIQGMPGASGRRVVFADQCRLCRMPMTPDAIVVAIDGGSGPTLPGPAALLCEACKVWFLALTADLRSIRGLRGRQIDGPYGTVIYGTVAPLTVAVAALDEDAGELVAGVARRMGAAVVEFAPADDEPEAAPDVLVVELARPADAAGWHRYGGTVIAMIPEALRTRLPEVAGNARADWITLPGTPQQVANALLRASRFPGGLPRDALAALPVAVEAPGDNPVLAVRVAAGVDRQLVAWRLKRYARGYDEVVTTVDGAIVILPRCEPWRAPAVARRLNELLAGLAFLAPAEFAPRQGIDVSG